MIDEDPRPVDVSLEEDEKDRAAEEEWRKATARLPTNTVESDSSSVPSINTAHAFWMLAMRDLVDSNERKVERETKKLQIAARGEEAFLYGRGVKRARDGDDRNHHEDDGRKRGKFKAAHELDPQVDLCPGDARIRNIRRIYTNGFFERVNKYELRPIVPSDDQLEFMECCLVASLPKIYGESDWATHGPRVLQQFKLTKVDFYVMMITARRMG